MRSIKPALTASTLSCVGIALCGLQVGFRSAALSPAQEITVEPQRKLVPAGPGQKPFDVTRHSIPLPEIHGSVPRDWIPSLGRPEFLPAKEADRLLKRSDRVLGIVLNGEAKAYPLRILNWHELVNDSLGNSPVLVSW